MAEMNFEQARFNMIEQQIRPWDVLDQRILDLIFDLHREDFVPEAYHALAFADINIPLVHDQVMMSPKLEGRVLQELRLEPTDRVLEIGTGSGYVTALLAMAAHHVETVDIYDTFTEAAEAKLKAHNIYNVSLNTGDAINGWKPDNRYDAILLTGSVPVLKPHFQEQLEVGGRLFVITGEDPAMQGKLITRIQENEWTSDTLFETSIPALIGAPEPPRFVL